MHEGAIVGAVIPAAGGGVRMGSADPKQFLELEGKPIIAWALEPFQNAPEVDTIVIATGSSQIGRMERIVADEGASKVSMVVAGGEHRQDSVRNGLRALASKGVGIVLIHDGVRPFVDPVLIGSVLAGLAGADASIAAMPARETVKLSHGGAIVASTPPREEVWLAQTPQAFRYADLCRAIELASSDGFLGTDEAGLVERLGKKVALVKESWENIKITRAGELELARRIARRRKART